MQHLYVTSQHDHRFPSAGQRQCAAPIRPPCPGDLFGLPGVMSSGCAIAVFCSQGSVVRTDGVCQIDAAFWRSVPFGPSRHAEYLNHSQNSFFIPSMWLRAVRASTIRGLRAAAGLPMATQSELLHLRVRTDARSTSVLCCPSGDGVCGGRAAVGPSWRGDVAKSRDYQIPFFGTISFFSSVCPSDDGVRGGGAAVGRAVRADLVVIHHTYVSYKCAGYTTDSFFKAYR